MAINDPNLLWSAALGTETWVYYWYHGGDTGEGGTDTAQATATLGNLLSPTGTWGTLENLQTGTFGCRYGCPQPSAAPIAGSGTVTFDEYNTVVRTVSQWDTPVSENYWAAQTGTIQGQIGSVTLTLPTVYESTTSQVPGASGVISGGGSVALTANSLSNRGGQIGAGGNITLNVQSLSNGAVAPTVTARTTDWVDQTQLTAFVNALKSLNGAVGIYGTGDPSGTYGCSGQQDCLLGEVTPPTTFTFASSVVAPSAVSTLTWSTPTGLIAAGNDMTVNGGNLVNEGTLYAQHNVNLNGATITNQGSGDQQTSTQTGCAAGTSNLDCIQFGGSVRGENPNTSTFRYTQDNASIIAGNDLTISAGTINNTYGNLIAGHDIVVTGVGTSAGSTTAAQSLTNTSGNILAGNDITLNVSGAVTNTLPPPVPVHQNYGQMEQYSGCMTAGGYKESYCEGYVDQQSGDSSVISAGHNLNIQAGTLTNVGSLITAGVNAVINVAGPVVNQQQTLNAYWHSHWVQETSVFSPDKRHEVWGCGSAAECTALYGNAYTNVGGVIDPPTPVGNIAAAIQAPNLTVTSGGQIVNVGNVVGQSVSLTGTNLANGITKSNTYTPVVGNPPQVISLAPASGGLNLSIPATLGGYSLTQMNPQAVSGRGITPASSGSSSIDYVLDGTGTTLDRVTPQLLLSNLPSNLQPSTSLFYYNRAGGRRSVADGGAKADRAGDVRERFVDGQPTAIVGYRPGKARVVRERAGVCEGEQHPAWPGADTAANWRADAPDAVVRGADGPGAGVHGDGYGDVSDGDGIDAAGVLAGEYIGALCGRQHRCERQHRAELRQSGHRRERAEHGHDRFEWIADGEHRHADQRRESS